MKEVLTIPYSHFHPSTLRFVFIPRGKGKVQSIICGAENARQRHWHNSCLIRFTKPKYEILKALRLRSLAAYRNNLPQVSGALKRRVVFFKNKCKCSCQLCLQDTGITRQASYLNAARQTKQVDRLPGPSFPRFPLREMRYVFSLAWRHSGLRRSATKSMITDQFSLTPLIALNMMGREH